MKILKAFYGYVLFVIIAMVAYTIYKLVDLSWFTNASISTILAYGLVVPPLIGVLVYTVIQFIKTFKGKSK